MANMSLKKNPMPSQDPNVRNKNFLEVALGYTEEMAIDEAKRCIQCKNPRCITSVESDLRHLFKITEDGIKRCVYCESEYKS